MFFRQDMAFFDAQNARMAELAAKEPPVFEGSVRSDRENDGPDFDGIPF